MAKDMDRLVGQVVASGALSKAQRARVQQEAKEARRKHRRSEREVLRIAAKAENWDDRDGKARPTPQRRLRGVFSLRDGDAAGVAVAVDQAEGVINSLGLAGVLTARQCDAGRGFEEVARGVLGSPGGRSCINFDPVGHDGDDDQSETAQRRWNSLRRTMQQADRAECIAVCWEGHQPRDLARLVRGLNATADWLGLHADE